MIYIYNDFTFPFQFTCVIAVIIGLLHSKSCKLNWKMSGVYISLSSFHFGLKMYLSHVEC